jgi:uncharacterized repeat protein (TIGR03943 family)
LDTLSQEYFATGERTLLIACEEGEIEYDTKELVKQNVYVEYVNEESDLTPGLLKKFDTSRKPKRVLIEYNGMWKVESIMEEIYPESWELAQIISTVDYSTFSMYWSNMRAMFINQHSLSDMVIFNRCDETAKKNELRRNVKLFNKKAQIGYDYVEGYNGSGEVEELPYDINSSEFTVEDDDYGIFYMDAMDNPDNYDGKTVHFNGVFFRPKKYPMNKFVPGRFIMACCAEDITFYGMLCIAENDVDFEERQWISVTADMKSENIPEYGSKGPVLYLKNIEAGTRPEDDLVYF